MPHQCLACGQAFGQGSKDLLKGCPGCKGTRFFYTAEPLDDAARAKKASEVGTDLREVLAQMAKEERIDPRALLMGGTFEDLLKADRELPPARAPAASSTSPVASVPTPCPPCEPLEAQAQTTPSPSARSPQPDAEERQLAALLSKPAEAPAMTTAVGTVHVHEPGSYTLDVERLLDAKPIVIEKEGVYVIHLASAFEAPGEGTAPRRRKR